MQINDLIITYKKKKVDIRIKLKEFESAFLKTDDEIFLELCFCILAAGTSAQLALDTVEKVKGVIFNADAYSMQKALKEARYRFHTVRANYIVRTRDYLGGDCGFQIKDKIKSFDDKIKLREYFAGNKGIKGIAYKEGSHFLRNIGVRGYAILDKHVVNSLYELGAIDSDKRPAGRSSYLALERKMKDFAANIGIDFDELDLLLWYSKTGTIIK